MKSPDYENIKADILEFSGGKRLLTIAEVSRYTGLRDYRTVHKRFPAFVDGKINVPILARLMCEGGLRK